jgi:hypothetical protein
LKLNGTLHHLVHADDVNVLGRSVRLKENADTLVVASKEYMVMSRVQHVGRSHRMITCQVCSLHVTRVHKPKKNFFIQRVKTHFLNWTNGTKTHGPRLSVHWDSGERCAACRQAKQYERRAMRLSDKMSLYRLD